MAVVNRLDSSRGVMWVIDTLAVDTDLRNALGVPLILPLPVYLDVVPAGKTIGIAVSLVSSQRPLRAHRRLVWQRTLVQTKIVSRDAHNDAVIDAVVNALQDKVMQSVSGQNSTVYTCERDSDRQYTEAGGTTEASGETGVRWMHTDIVWALRVKAL